MTKRNNKMHEVLVATLNEQLGDVLAPSLLEERAAGILEVLRLNVGVWPIACLQEAQYACAELFADEPEPAPEQGRPSTSKSRQKKKKKATQKGTTEAQREHRRIYAAVRRAAERFAEGRATEDDRATLAAHPNIARPLLEKRGCVPASHEDEDENA